MYDPIFMRAMEKGKFENRFLDKIDVLLCLSEKEVAAVASLTIEGKTDYHGFHPEDQPSSK
jgi:hypothetical protein